MRRYVVVLVASLTLVEGGASFAQGECPTIFPSVNDSFFLDTFAFQGVATSTATLVSGAPYQLALDGTYSIFAPGTWTSFPLCAGSQTENAPRYPSPVGPQTGKVGMDAHHFFASQIVGGVCVGGPPPLPAHNAGFQVCKNGNCPSNPALAAGWFHPGAGEAYRPDHVYGHRIVGQGFTLATRRPDSPYGDNYGRIKVTVRSATSAELVEDIIDRAEALDASAFRNANQQAAFLQKLDALLGQVSEGEACDGALQKLCHDLLPKTDGESRPPDWVIDADAQQDLEDLILQVTNALGGCK